MTRRRVAAVRPAHIPESAVVSRRRWQRARRLEDNGAAVTQQPRRRLFVRDLDTNDETREFANFHFCVFVNGLSEGELPVRQVTGLTLTQGALPAFVGIELATTQETRHRIKPIASSM